MASHRAMAFGLQSAAVRNNEFMSSEQANDKCGGKNISPDLLWKNVPDDAKSLALIVHDPDAPPFAKASGGKPKSGGFYHWLVVDIPAATTGIEMGARFSPSARELVTDFGVPGYNGPCPPIGGGVHHYHFTVYALNVKKIDLAANLTPAQIESAIKSHSLASATITGLYERE